MKIEDALEYQDEVKKASQPAKEDVKAEGLDDDAEDVAWFHFGLDIMAAHAGAAVKEKEELASSLDVDCTRLERTERRATWFGAQTQ